MPCVFRVIAGFGPGLTAAYDRSGSASAAQVLFDSFSVYRLKGGLGSPVPNGHRKRRF